MSRFIGRSLLACGLLIVLSSCQSMNKQVNEPVVDEFIVAGQIFETYLATKQLDLAGQQLEEIRANHPDEQRLAALQQRLANAWLKAGERALQKSDIETASAALIQAKRLLPQAPALTEGLSEALNAAQTPAVKSVTGKQIALPRSVENKKPAQKKPQKPSEPVLLPSDAEVESPAPILTPPAARSKLKARILDVNAPYTVVPLPMLSSRNDYQLGRLLDDVAIDVVKFRAAVSIEVADTRDFHWVAALLSARVKKLDASFTPRLQEIIRHDEPAQLVITPNKAL